MLRKRTRRPLAHRRLRLIALGCTAATATLGLSGCTASSDSEVVVGFYPLEYLASTIGGSAIDVQNLAQPGAEPHDMELTPKQIGAVSSASLVIYEKGLQPALDDAIANERPAQVLDVATVTELVDTSGESGHQHDSHEGEHEHGPHGELDPHIWLDPGLMLTMAEAVHAKLTEVDAAHKATYDENYHELAKKLQDLDAEFTAGLASCQRTSFVTTHSAFGYLAKAYGLEQVGVTGMAEEEPSPQTLAEVKQFVEENGVTTVFYEEAVSDKYAKTIAEETGAQTAVLNPLEVAPATGDYISAMRQNLQALRTALECA